MNFLKLALGGIVAVLSAFGLTTAVLVILSLLEVRAGRATGLGVVSGGWALMLHSGWFWLSVFVIFAMGLFLSYRKLYL